ncbi:BTAD domain-containing putative transcriptional regulator [Actinoplanes sp. NPDC049265]|uniref:BTAD domain-containing putative transcriptional regulator n=1 Tax=Actinoplanes sp. NPDC049265 TaxID=3363902 RepID=UPI0037113ADE
MRHPLHYRVLGPLEVLRDGRAVELGGPKQRAVLAVLLLEAGRVVSTDRLAAALWEHDPPPTAVATLQAYLSNLRRLLRADDAAPPPITRRAPGYVLEPADGRLDLTEFLADADAARDAVRDGDWAGGAVAARRGLDRWRGPLLGDLRDEHWVRPEAAARDERRVECAENLITALLGLNRIPEAVGQAGVLAASAPLDERAARLRMIALYRAGRSGEALGAYRDHAAALAEELGLEPGPALRELQAAILRQDPDLAGWPGAVSSSVQPRSSEPMADARPWPSEPMADARPRSSEPMADARPRSSGSVAGARPLIGRKHELSVIAEAVEQALTGRPRWLVLTGPAGIGKSRLAGEAVARWQDGGGRAIRVACPEDDGLPPWWPVRSLLRSLGADADAVLTVPGGLEVDEARFAVADRASAILAEAARPVPLLMLVDDVQWADSASLRFLTQLATVAGAGPAAVVLALRDDQITPDVQRLLAGVSRHAGGGRIEVPALTREEVADLAASVSGDALSEADVRELAERTGGNPFFVGEYARRPAAERAAGALPGSVRAVLGRRLADVEPAVLHLLRTAAVIGDPFEVDLLRAVLRLAPDPLADLLDEAIEAGLIDVSPASDAYVFRHALLREEVLLGIPPVRRRRLHARVADALDAGPGAGPVDRRAGHLVAALPYLDPAPVHRACRDAARAAERQWDSDAAAHWWHAALQVFPHLPVHAGTDAERDELLDAYVAALARAGRDQKVLDVVDGELLLAGREGRVASMGKLAGALLRTAGGWPWVSYTADPQPLLTRLMSIEPLVDADPAAHARVLAALAVGSCYDPDGALSDRLSARAVARAEESGDPDVLADALLARALVFCGVVSRVAEVKDLLRRLSTVRHTQERVDEVLSHNMLCWAELTAGEVDTAEKHLRLGVGGCELLRLPVARAQLRWAEGSIALWRGQFAEARATYRHAYELHRRTELYGPGVYDIATLTGQWNQGRAVAAGPAEVDHSSVPWARVAGHVAAGRLAEADRTIGEILAARQTASWLTYGTLTMLAHLIAEMGTSRHTRELIDRLSPVSHRIATIGHVGVAGPIALAVARLHHLLGDDDAARSQLAVATAVADRGAGAPALARCRSLAGKLAH